MTAKTSAERQKDWRDRQKGKRQINTYMDDDFWKLFHRLKRVYDCTNGELIEMAIDSLNRQTAKDTAFLEGKTNER